MSKELPEASEGVGTKRVYNADLDGEQGSSAGAEASSKAPGNMGQSREEEFLAAAKEAEERGWSIVPIRANKKPLGKWKEYQSRKPTQEEIDSWASNPDISAWAVVTGKISNLFIVDFDGAEGIRKMEEWGLEPNVITGSGGAHVYYEYPAGEAIIGNFQNKEGIANVDVRGEGGYAAFYGKNTSGRYYQTDNFDEKRPFSKIPGELKPFLSDKSKKSAKPAVDNEEAVDTLDSKVVRYPKQVDELLREALSKLPQGRDNACFHLATQLRDNGYSKSYAKTLMGVFHKNLPDTDTKGNHDPLSLETALGKVDGAYQQPAREPSGRPIHDNEIQPREDPGMVLLDHAALAARPKVKWLVKDFLPERCFAYIYGPPASGKSFLVDDIGRTIAAGKSSWHGEKASGDGGVVLKLSGEGWGDAYERGEVWYRYYNNSEYNVPFYEVQEGGDLTSPDFKSRIRDLITSQELEDRLKVIIIDNLFLYFGDGDENSAKDYRKFIKSCKELQEEYDCAVLVVHHSGKDIKRGGRGSNAMQGAVDVEVAVQMQNGFIHFEVTKMKYSSKKLEKQFGFKFVETGFDEDGDKTGSSVLIPVEKPDIDDSLRAFEGMTDRLKLVYKVMYDYAIKNGGDTSIKFADIKAKAKAEVEKDPNASFNEGSLTKTLDELGAGHKGNKGLNYIKRVGRGRYRIVDFSLMSEDESQEGGAISFNL